MSPEALARATDEVARHLGLRIGGALRHRLRRLITSASSQAGIDPLQWASSLAVDRWRLDEVIRAVTIQESAWFRDPAQFVGLQRLVLPAARGTLIWSAGVAAGQEPYSLAMMLREGGRRSWTVLATDIDATALTATAAGVFQPSQLGGLDPVRQARWLRAIDRAWVVRDDLRAQVSVRRHNLATEPLPPEIERCDVVFCRHVLIYLTDDGATTFLSRLADALRPGAVLFLGGSEALWRDTPEFVPVNLGGCYCYRRRETLRTGATLGTPSRGQAPQAHTSAPAQAQAQTSGLPQPQAQTSAAAPPLAAPPSWAASPSWARPSGAEPTAIGPGPPAAAALLAAGSSALDRGETAEAIRLLRQAAYVDPDLALAHFTLGLALETDGNIPAARRAWSAARAALVRAGTTDARPEADEPSSELLVDAIDLRLGNSARPERADIRESQSSSGERPRQR